MFNLDAFKLAVKAEAVKEMARRVHRSRKLSLDEWLHEDVLQNFTGTLGTADSNQCYLPKEYYREHWGMTFEEVCQHLRTLGFAVEQENKRKHCLFISIPGFTEEMRAYNKSLKRTLGLE